MGNRQSKMKNSDSKRYGPYKTDLTRKMDRRCRLFGYYDPK